MTDVKVKDVTSNVDSKSEINNNDDAKMESNESSVVLQDRTNNINNINNSKEEATPIAKGRAKRNIKEVNYNENDNNDDSDDESDDENENPLLEGLSKDEIKSFKKDTANTLESYNETIMKERLQMMEEIKNVFECNIDIKITDEEASFIYDFCKKFQFNIHDKIENEGQLFLENMREMMEEKKKTMFDAKAIKERLKKKRKKNRNNNNNNSDSEYSASSDDYDYDDSSFSYDEYDNENLITDEDDDDEEFVIGGYGSKKKRRKKKKYTYKKGQNADGTQRCGRLLLDDAMKDTTNFEGWSQARVEAYQNRKDRPNAYYYRFNDVGVKQKNGGFNEKKEIETYMARIMEYGTNYNWGVFSTKILGRVGYQCSNFWRDLNKAGKVKDYNYKTSKDGNKIKLTFVKLPAKWKAKTKESFKRYAFKILKPIPGPFNVGDMHPKCPRNLGKLLKQLGIRADDVYTNSNSDTDNDADSDNNTDDNNNNNNNDNSSKKKKGKSKKKTKKKSKKTKDNSDDSNKKSKKKTKKSSKKKDSNKKTKKKKSKTNNISPKTNNKKRTKDEMDVDSTNDNNNNNIEPPKKKRKKSKKSHKMDIDAAYEQQLINECVLGKFVDPMTGKQIIRPAISPYGHVVGYEQFVKILQKSKNICPFTKQKLTRRQLIKLTKDNIDEYKDKIVNTKAL